MKSNQELYQERLNRMTQAVTLGRPDRVPVMAWIDAWAATYRKGSMAKLSQSALYSNKLILETAKDFPQLDMIEVGAALPRAVAAATLSTVKVAGKELPEGSLWQVEELDHLQEADYDRILKIGWKAYKKEYYKKVLGWGGYDTFKLILGGIIAGRRCKKAGFPELSGAFPNIPLDPLAGGRGMAKFMTDLYRMPDKLKEVMDIMVIDIIEENKGIIKQAKPFSAFLGVARGSSNFLSPKLWNKFVWPYVVQIVNAMVESGTFVNLHFDGEWNRDIERFKELPKGKCIWASDSVTSVYKLKEVLGDHMCIKGDVPPALLALGKPEDVYSYCSKLIKDIGPTGFILAPGCTTPYNTKVENFKAMIAAATGQ
ncbi:uroporphyrinogen decarboxylase family protein [Holophaga foetida]|uniref:uroporphyrinogen decarboxylase family protein n=1 Tax=Holophaga foetida TaxID=35839 RepID=UPI000247177E|nr:uroporphyrinogen decarboxylase family protein [Holophaga foetida]